MYLAVTNISQAKRMKIDNLKVAALWFGPVKLKMDVILEPVLKGIKTLHKGIEVTYKSD